MRDDDHFHLLGRKAPIVRFALAFFFSLLLFNVHAVGFPAWARLLPPLTGPYANAHVGDWVSFKAADSDATTKRTVVHRTAVSITIRHESNAKSPPVDRTIEFTGPKAKDDATVEVLDTGKETLTIAGKKHDGEWTKTKITYPGKVSLTAFHAPIAILRKKWICKDVPLDGEIKSEVETGGHKTGWEMTGFGRGK